MPLTLRSVFLIRTTRFDSELSVAAFFEVFVRSGRFADEFAGVGVDGLLGRFARFDFIGDRGQLHFFLRFALVGYLSDMDTELRLTVK